MSLKKIFILFFVLIIVGASVWYLQENKKPKFETKEESDVYVRFDMEAYDQIYKNYWQDHATYNLPEYFRQSLSKVTNREQTLSTSTRAGVAEMLFGAFEKATSTESKKILAKNLLMVVTFNLLPVGRNTLMSKEEETTLRQNVANINPSSDLYKTVGASQSSSTVEVKQAYENKIAELKNATSTVDLAKKEEIKYAYKVVSTPQTKTLYDQNKIEPTAFNHVIGKTLYLYFDKISPTTLIEFGRIIDEVASVPLDSMIIDLRGNVGGALEFAQAFLGIFIGQNQYAFDLFHQGIYDAQRTTLQKFNGMARFKEIAILADGMTQSTAELSTVALKRYNLAKVVGTKTRGWGTVENTYPINTKIDDNVSYSLFLVNSVTLRDDNQPVEGRGVDPDVLITEKNWQEKLPDVFRSKSLIEAIKKMATQNPVR